MTTINNKEIIERIIRDTKMQLSFESPPNQLARSVVPVLISNPKKYTNYVKTRSSAGTIDTVSTSEKTYITAIQLGAASTQAATAGNASITIVPKGKPSVQLAKVSGATTVAITAWSDQAVIQFHYPILLEKGSAATLVANTVTSAYCTIFGYTEED